MTLLRSLLSSLKGSNFRFKGLVHSPWFFALILVLGINPEATALELRVAVEEGDSQLQIGTSSTAVLRGNGGQNLGQITPMQGLKAQFQQGQVKVGQWKASQMWVEPVDANGFVWVGDRWYRGKVRLIPSSDGLLAVNHVNLEDYLYSVVGSEMPTHWPLEALKSQAVAARSYALHKRAKLANANYDLGDTTTWQVYKGIEAETASTQAAVGATQGQVLTHGGTIIEAVFHSSSGGHTENVEDVWSQAVPYLRGVADFDHHAPVFTWQKHFTAEQMRQRITGVGHILSMTPVETTPHGRVRQMKVVGDAGQRVLTGNELRNALGLRSSLFVVSPQAAMTGSAAKSLRPAAFVVSGRGFGHGLGLSQWGAYGLALRGYSYQQILGHYYQNAALAQIQVVP